MSLLPILLAISYTTCEEDEILDDDAIIKARVIVSLKMFVLWSASSVFRAFRREHKSMGPGCNHRT